MCNLNVIVVLEYISRDLYLLFAIRFSSKFQNSVFYQHMRPKSGLKSLGLFIRIHEIESQIFLTSDLRVIVHCHSIHLILFQHPGFVNSSGTRDFVCISPIFQDFSLISHVFNFHE